MSQKYNKAFKHYLEIEPPKKTYLKKRVLLSLNKGPCWYLAVIIWQYRGQHDCETFESSIDEF